MPSATIKTRIIAARTAIRRSKAPPRNPKSKIQNPKSPRASSHRAIFLDRDGTIVEEVGYLRSADQLRLIPGAAEGLGRLSRLGYLLVVTTNQSAIARGWLTEAALEEIHSALRRMLAQAGVALDAIYYCPHLPDAVVERYRKECACRKPKTGMIERAVKELGIDPRRSWVIGDSARDVAAGKAAGCRTILINQTGSDLKCEPDCVAPDLAGAADAIAERQND